VDSGSAPGSPNGTSLRRRLRSLSPWDIAVALSVLVLAFAGAAMGALRLTSGSTSSASVVIRQPLTQVELTVERGDVEVLGGGGQNPVVLRHVDRSSFGHEPSEQRSVRGGVLRVRSRCPTILLGFCSTDYRLIVPDNVAVSVKSLHGGITLDAVHGSADLETDDGPIKVDAFCGFVLHAATNGGRIEVGTSCSPQRLELISSSGDISAVVPQGHYEVEAGSSSGRTNVRGLASERGAPWSIQAISNSGDIDLQAAS
jgi:hypothetical protein